MNKRKRNKNSPKRRQQKRELLQKMPTVSETLKSSVKTEEKDDDVLFEDVVFDQNDLGLIKQLENVVGWQILGLYKENGKINTPFSLKRNPPLLNVESSTGEMAQFMLTPEFCRDLASALERVYYAYYGVDKSGVKIRNADGSEDKTLVQKVYDYVMAHPAKIGVSVFLILIIVAILFLPML